VLVGILDLGINNLTSVRRSFSNPLGVTDSITIIGGGEKEERPDLLVLPGLGKFGTGMLALQERSLIEKIKNWTSDGSKLVGICLGMQLLGTTSEESPGVEGLNFISSRIERLPSDRDERVPHTGWAETNLIHNSTNFSSLNEQGDFYFVHSYHLLPDDDKSQLTSTPFGKFSFVSSVVYKNILGVQFHVEKSGSKGKKLVSEIIEWARNED
jgi:imidazole glycerol phosphate synthase glutamine amidotransferase subunit